MQYIDEMYPWTIVDFKKYRTYLELRKEREKFLKSLCKKRSCDWRIEKKLLDAGGLGDHVYLYLARGQSRQRSMEEYLDLLESGRDDYHKMKEYIESEDFPRAAEHERACVDKQSSALNIAIAIGVIKERVS